MPTRTRVRRRRVRGLGRGRSLRCRRRRVRRGSARYHTARRRRSRRPDELARSPVPGVSALGAHDSDEGVGERHWQDFGVRTRDDHEPRSSGLWVSTRSTTTVCAPYTRREILAVPENPSERSARGENGGVTADSSIGGKSRTVSELHREVIKLPADIRYTLHTGRVSRGVVLGTYFRSLPVDAVCGTPSRRRLACGSSNERTPARAKPDHPDLRDHRR